MDGALYLVVIVSFVATWIATRKWIRKAPEIGLLGFDMNKPGRPKVAEMGGIRVVKRQKILFYLFSPSRVYIIGRSRLYETIYLDFSGFVCRRIIYYSPFDPSTAESRDHRKGREQTRKA